jgi:hypothetical protein
MPSFRWLALWALPSLLIALGARPGPRPGPTAAPSTGSAARLQAQVCAPPGAWLCRPPLGGTVPAAASGLWILLAPSAGKGPHARGPALDQAGLTQPHWACGQAGRCNLVEEALPAVSADSAETWHPRGEFR